MTEVRIGVVGLGQIGRGVASSAASKEHEVAVFDIREEAMTKLGFEAKACSDLGELAASSDIVVICVVDDDQVADVAAQLIAEEGTVVCFVIVSTIRPGTVREVERRAAAAAVAVVDCGVSGGAAAAASGRLIAMVGGSDEAVERAKPAIEAFSSIVIHTGELGTGLVAKLARNLIQYGSWLAAAEGQRLAEAGGVRLRDLALAVKESDKLIGGVSTLMFRDTTARLESGDPLVAPMRAGAGLAVKDLSSCVELGAELAVDLPVAHLARTKAGEIFGTAPPPSPTGGSPRPPASNRAGGRQRMQQVYGFSADPGDSEGDFLAYTVDHLFGDVWSRPGLDTRSRRLLTIAVLAAQGSTDLVGVQFAAALANGEMDEGAVRETVLHLAHYAGWPVGANLNNAAEKAIAAHRRGEAQ